MTIATGLNLRAYELRQLTTALERLERSGIKTDYIIVGSHKVHVRFVDGDSSDQRDSGYWLITGIERTRG
jgi:uncharacterized linocin/CFP29 family protein